jgi:ubiquinone/menaquinone biosynthesis C-methylase UbiE
MNLITKYRLAKAIRRGLRLITIQTAIEEGYQRILSKPLTIDGLCDAANYNPSMKSKVKLFLDALASYAVVRQEYGSDGVTHYRWSRRSGHAEEAKDIKTKTDELLSRKYCGELLRGQHIELARNWRRMVRGEPEDELTRAREMIAISIGLRAELMQEGRKRALGIIGIKPGTNAIDIGCGAGTSTIQLAEAVGPQGHVSGVEVDENLYSEAVVRYQELSSSYRKSIAEIDFVMADIRDEALRALGGDFDAATTFLFWHYIKEDDYVKVLMNINEGLKQNGRIGGIQPMHLRSDDVFDGEWAGTAISEFTYYPFIQKFRSTLKECGFGKFKFSKMVLTFRAHKD